MRHRHTPGTRTARAGGAGRAGRRGARRRDDAGAARRGAPRDDAGGARRAVRAAATLLAALALAAALGAGAAQAATPAAVSTGGASSVASGSAILTGSVNPEGSGTSYYFQYGPTAAYGAQTGISEAGAGKSTLTVRVPIAGLQPLTVYHYRLVAVNGAGAAFGGDRSLLTTRVPYSLAILASPAPVTYGHPAVISGTLFGTGNANRVIYLQANPWPYAGGWQTLGNALLTSNAGSFGFPLLSMTASTQYRVVAEVGAGLIGPVITEPVAVAVESHVVRAARAGFVRFYGRVYPAQDGAQVGIMRARRGLPAVPAAGTRLRHGGSTFSTFSTLVRARRGSYRVLVRITAGPLVSAYGRSLGVG